MSSTHEISRRQFLISTAAVGGALVLGFRIPSGAAQAANIAPKPWTPPVEGGQEVNAWLIIGSDDTVTIRVAQSEMGQGLFATMPMIVAEELACDWTKVRAEYASANRSLRQNRVYQRMGTGGSRAVRGSREYLQQAGASARVRLVAAAAQQWSVPASECKTDNGLVVHPASWRAGGRGAIRAAAAGGKFVFRPPDQYH